MVTVFGFPNNEATGNLVLQEFGKCGDILRYHSDKQCNWMHIQYGVSCRAVCIPLALLALLVFAGVAGTLDVLSTSITLLVVRRQSMRLSERCSRMAWYFLPLS